MRICALAFTLCALSAQALTLTAVQSRKAHPTGSGTYDLRIDTAQNLSGIITIEPRAIGTGHTVVFQFDGPVASAGKLSVVEDGLTLLAGATATPSGSEVAVTLPVITDNKRITVTLTNVNGIGLNASASLGFLIGDVNDSRSINAGDASAAKARSGQAASAANSRFDVNASGAITASDIAAIKARSGSALAVPPVLIGATIGAGGGVINGPDGVQIAVPPDAVTDPVTFRVDRGATGAPELSGLNALTPVYAVTPHGQLFEGSAVFSIPLAAAQIPAGATPILLKSELGGTWRVMRNISTDPARMAADIDGLSYFVIGTCSSSGAEWTIGAVDCPANHELRLTMLDGDSSVQILRGPNGVQLPLWYVTDTPQTRSFIVDWFRPTSTRVDQVSVLGSRGGFSPNPQDVTGGTFARRFDVTIDPAQVAGAASANGKLIRVTASAEYSTTAFRVGTGNVPVGFVFETDIPILVRYNAVLPTISTQPANVGVLAGQPASFTVVASGPNLTYQWSRRANASAAFVTIGGATAPTLTLPAALFTDNGAQFQVLVCMSPTACVPSLPATLSVIQSGAAPTFILQPGDRSVIAGQTASFSVIATGQPLPEVKWQVAPPGSNVFSDVLGVVTCAPYSLPAQAVSFGASCTVAVSLGDNGRRYRAVAANVVAPGGVASTFATLTVTAVPMAPVIIEQPAPQTFTVGGSATFSVKVSGTAVLEYSWRMGSALANLPSVGGPVAGRFAVTGNGGDCRGFVTYSNERATITLSDLTAPCDRLAPVVMVTNTIIPNATSNGATLTLRPVVLPTFTSLPTSQAVDIGQTATFTVAATGLDLTYQWLRNARSGLDLSTLEDLRGLFEDIPGATANSYTTAPATLADDATAFGVRVCDGAAQPPSYPNCYFYGLVSYELVRLSINEVVSQNFTEFTNITTANLTSVAFSTSSDGVAVGTGGTILRTSDGGMSWSGVTSGTTANLRTVAFSGNGNGMITGENGLLFTSDHGATWAATLPGDNGVCCLAVAYADPATAVVSYRDGFMRSTNGGQFFASLFPTSFRATGLRFGSALIGAAVNGSILYTIDGGSNWITAAQPPNIGVSTLAFVNSSVALAVSYGGALLYTIDGGKNWNSLYGGGFTRYAYALAFNSAGIGLALGEGPSNGAMRTDNFGQTWIPLGLPPFAGPINAVAFIDPIVNPANPANPTNKVVIAVGAGTIVRFTEAGL